MSKSQPSFQVRPESDNQILREIDKLMQDWEQRITPDNLRLASRFINFDLDILLYFRVEPPAEMWVARFQPVRASNHWHPAIGEQIVPSDREQGSVLVDVVKLMDSPQRVIPALVRLEPVNCF
jgi:hypothetical protein